jgi:hypothetical protein
VLANGEIICPNGSYKPYDGATEWKKQHDSATENDTLKVYARFRHTGEDLGEN